MAVPSGYSGDSSSDIPAFSSVVEVEAGVNHHVVSNVQGIVLRGICPLVAEFGFLDVSLQLSGSYIQLFNCSICIVVNGTGCIGVNTSILSLQECVVKVELSRVESHCCSIGSDGILVQCLNGNKCPFDVGSILSSIEDNGSTCSSTCSILILGIKAHIIS